MHGAETHQGLVPSDAKRTPVDPGTPISRFPKSCMPAREALDFIGHIRFGANWTAFCPVCFGRASANGIDATARREKSKYFLSAVIGPGLIVSSSVFCYVMIEFVLIQYVPALVAFYLLALACAILLAVYGIVGLVRRHGLFHRHPIPDDATLTAWRAIVEELERLVCDGSLRVFALTMDGELHRISESLLDPQIVHRGVCGDDSNAVWTAFRKRLGLRNAPSGEFVVARDDLSLMTEAR